MRRNESRAHRAVLIGYGPTGRTVARMLKENGIEPTVVEFNIDTVRDLREHGVDAVYGDATRPETLIEAGIATAGNLILTSAGMANSTEVIRAAREAESEHPRARARVVPARPAELKRAGADTVFTGEGEVALAFVEDLLSRLGATAEQIDRERARAHDELFGDGAAIARSSCPAASTSSNLVSGYIVRLRLSAGITMPSRGCRSARPVRRVSRRINQWKRSSRKTAPRSRWIASAAGRP